MESATLTVSQGNIDNNHIYVTELLRVTSFLPTDFADGKAAITIEAAGLNKAFDSERWRNRFRNRQFARAFFRFHAVKAGDKIVFEKLGSHRFNVRPMTGKPLATLTHAPIAVTDESQAFRLERHLEDFIAHNWSRIKELRGWELIKTQYPTETGPLDMLAKHKTRAAYLVVELKRDQSSDETIGQICRYMAWVDAHLAKEGDEVEGIVVAHEQDNKIRYAVRRVRDVSLLTYEIAFTLKPVEQSATTKGLATKG